MIKCNDLTKYYKGESNPAIANLSINVAKGSVFGFLGPNGAGKTTTIKILTGLMSADSGEVYLADKKMSIASPEIKAKIGYLGQDHKMYPWMKCRELLLFVGKIFKLPKSVLEKRADELLEISGLSDARNKKVSSLSGGMTQRLGIAQAIMGNPEILFLDEPTSALDPIGRKEVLDFIFKIKETCTVFMSTHILADVERVCDSIAIIDKGKILVQEKTSVIKEKFSEKIIEIEFSNPNELESFAEQLEDNSQIGEIIRIENNLLTIHPTDIRNSKSNLLQMLAKSDAEIVRFEYKQASLEDVFVKLIGGEYGK